MYETRTWAAFREVKSCLLKQDVDDLDMPLPHSPDLTVCRSAGPDEAGVSLVHVYHERSPRESIFACQVTAGIYSLAFCAIC